MFCPYCGTELKDVAIFCKSCGKEVRRSKATLTPKTNKERSPEQATPKRSDSAGKKSPVKKEGSSNKKKTTNTKGSTGKQVPKSKKGPTPLTAEQIATNKKYELASVLLRCVLAALIAFAPFIKVSISLWGYTESASFTLPSLAKDALNTSSDLQYLGVNASELMVVGVLSGAIAAITIIRLLYTAYQVFTGKDASAPSSGGADGIIAGGFAVVLTLVVVSSICNEFGAWGDFGELLGVFSCTPWAYLTIAGGIADIAITKKRVKA